VRHSYDTKDKYIITHRKVFPGKRRGQNLKYTAHLCENISKDGIEVYSGWAYKRKISGIIVANYFVVGKDGMYAIGDTPDLALRNYKNSEIFANKIKIQKIETNINAGI